MAGRVEAADHRGQAEQLGPRDRVARLVDQLEVGQRRQLAPQLGKTEVDVVRARVGATRQEALRAHRQQDRHHRPRFQIERGAEGGAAHPQPLVAAGGDLDLRQLPVLRRGRHRARQAPGGGRPPVGQQLDARRRGEVRTLRGAGQHQDGAVGHLPAARGREVVGAGRAQD